MKGVFVGTLLSNHSLSYSIILLITLVLFIVIAIAFVFIGLSYISISFFIYSSFLRIHSLCLLNFDSNTICFASMIQTIISICYPFLLISYQLLLFYSFISLMYKKHTTFTFPLHDS